MAAGPSVNKYGYGRFIWYLFHGGSFTGSRIDFLSLWFHVENDGDRDKVRGCAPMLCYCRKFSSTSILCVVALCHCMLKASALTYENVACLHLCNIRPDRFGKLH